MPVARSPNRPDLLTPHSFRLIHQGVAQGNVGLAFGLVIFAGLTTTIGSAFVYCTSYANTKALAAALGASGALNVAGIVAQAALTPRCGRLAATLGKCPLPYDGVSGLSHNALYHLFVLAGVAPLIWATYAGIPDAAHG